VRSRSKEGGCVAHQEPEMTDIEKSEIEKANDLFKQHERMMRDHFSGNGPWNTSLHNQMVIQLQVAWPIAYREVCER